MDYITYTFNEDSWHIYVIEDEDNVTIDEDSEAETKFEQKELIFRKRATNYKIIAHELWHVYLSYCYLSDTHDIGIADFEEITAALFEDKAEIIIAKAKDIEQKLKKIEV